MARMLQESLALRHLAPDRVVIIDVLETRDILALEVCRYCLRGIRRAVIKHHDLIAKHQQRPHGEAQNPRAVAGRQDRHDFHPGHSHMAMSPAWMLCSIWNSRTAFEISSALTLPQFFSLISSLTDSLAASDMVSIPMFFRQLYARQLSPKYSTHSSRGSWRRLSLAIDSLHQDRKST